MTNRSRIVYNIMIRRGIVIPVYEEVMKPAPPVETPSMETPAEPSRNLWLNRNGLEAKGR